MSISQLLKASCPVCGKPAIENYRMGSMISLSCGHLIAAHKLGGSKILDEVVSSDGRTLFEYQKKGIQFVEEGNARVLIADEQGLGKTVQALGALRLHPELFPVLLVVKTTLKLQWFHEIIRWTGEQRIQLLQSSKDKALPGFKVYICTFDILKNAGMFDLLPAEFKIKTMIIDECQAIKNHLSERAKAVQMVAKDIEHIICLSGTPIKNHAGEYFTVLNLLQPSRFPSHKRYLDEYCDYYWNGYGTKVGGLTNPELFHMDTKDFIIRRTQKEVLPDLPEMNRALHHVELNKNFNDAYKSGMKELDELFYAETQDIQSMIAVMTKLRRITGLSKVAECVDYIDDFVEGTTDRKIVVFVHHKSVAALLLKHLTELMASKNFMAKPLSLHSGLNGDQRAELVKEFKDGPSRVMIASTLAAGEGLNLQFCSDSIMLERQWNPANEEQAEKRFHRIGQSNKVTVTYMLASETIDEYFTELVEQKRTIIKNTLDGETVAWDSNSLMKELAAVLISKGKGKWKL